MALEHAAAAVARLDMALAGHPLAAAWAYRVRLDAVRLQAAADGMMIDPWHLVALIEGVRLRLGPEARLSDRGAIFAAARHALALYQWSSRPDAAQQAAISTTAAHLATVADRHSLLLGGGRVPSMLGSIRVASAHLCAPPWRDTGSIVASPPGPARC